MITKRRSIKQLFETMLDSKHLFETGICKWIWKMYNKDRINMEEYINLNSYLKRNLPKPKYDSPHGDTIYCWEISKIKPRIEWIKLQIEKLEK